jgi:hypothetical protein
MSSPDCLPSSWVLFGRAKISGPDPLLTTVWTSYPTKPLLALLHPPGEPDTGNFGQENGGC